MIESPKALFLQAHSDAAVDLSELSQNRPMRLGAAFALAQMVYDGATREQLDGAKAFSKLLFTLGEPITQPATFPSKEIKN